MTNEDKAKLIYSITGDVERFTQAITGDKQVATKYKLIDILNKIANGELKEGTKVITKDGEEFTYKRSDIDEEYHELLNEECESLLTKYYIDLITDEVELIEPQEPTDNTKIEELEVWSISNLELYNSHSIMGKIIETRNKLNEVIRYINK